MENDIFFREIIFDLKIEDPNKFEEYCRTLSSFTKYFKDTLEKNNSLVVNGKKNIDTLEVELGEIDLSDFDTLKNLILEQIESYLNDPLQVGSSIKTLAESSQYAIKDKLCKLIVSTLERGFVGWPYQSKKGFNQFISDQISSQDDFSLLESWLSANKTNFYRFKQLINEKITRQIFHTILKNKYQVFSAFRRLYTLFKNSTGFTTKQVNFISYEFFEFILFKLLYRQPLNKKKTIYIILTYFIENHGLSIHEFENRWGQSKKKFWVNQFEEFFKRDSQSIGFYQFSQYKNLINIAENKYSTIPTDSKKTHRSIFQNSKEKNNEITHLIRLFENLEKISPLKTLFSNQKAKKTFFKENTTLIKQKKTPEIFLIILDYYQLKQGTETQIILEYLIEALSKKTILTEAENTGLRLALINYFSLVNKRRLKVKTKKFLRKIVRSISYVKKNKDLFIDEFIAEKNLINQLSISEFNELISTLFKGPINYAEILTQFLFLLPYHKRREYQEMLRGEALRFAVKDTFGKKNIDFYQFLFKKIEQIDKSVLPSGYFDLADKKRKILLQNFMERNESSFLQQVHQDKYIYEHFDYLLSLHIEFQEEKLTSLALAKNFISLKKILQNKDSLLEFLQAYQNEKELISTLAQISLQKEEKKNLDKLLKQINQDLFEIEQDLITIHENIRFTSLTQKAFVLISRYHLLENLSASAAKENQIEGLFTLDFILSLKTHARIFKDLMTKELDNLAIHYHPDVASGFSAFLDHNHYGEVPEIKRVNQYFKDYYLAYLKTGTSPVWGIDETVDEEEILKLIRSASNNNDFYFIKIVFETPIIVSKIIDDLLQFPTNELIKIIQGIEQKFTIVSLSLLLLHLQKSNVFKETIQKNKFFKYVFSQKLWEEKNRFTLFKKIKDNLIFSKAIELEIERYEKNTSLTHTIEKLDFEKNKPTKSQFIALFAIYFANQPLPVDPKLISKVVIPQMIQFLQKGSKEALDIVKEFFNAKLDPNEHKIFNNEVLKNIFLSTVEIEKREREFFIKIEEAISPSSAEEEKIIKIIFQSLFEEFVFQKQKSGFIIPYFLRSLRKFDITLDEKKEKKLLLNSTEIANKIKRLEYNEQLIDFNNELGIMKYFVEYGSYPNGITLSKIEANQLLIRLIKHSAIIVKKNLFAWSKNELKTERFFTMFVEKNNYLMIANLIAPGLSENFGDYQQLLDDLLSVASPTIKIENNDSALILRYIRSWSKESLSLRDSKKITVNLILDIWKTEKRVAFELQNVLEKQRTNLTPIQKDIVNLLKQHFSAPIKKVDPKVEIVTQEQMNEEVKKGIQIDNAGLIIAWPFFMTLFNKLNLIENKKFKNDSAISKAIIALQYMVNGQHPSDVSQLILNKILCGVELDFFVDLSLELSDAEKGICEMAVDAVVLQWDKIKSISTLQEYFFQRKGVLIKTEREINLHLESQTIDILLKFIPWNLSIVKTSIMKNQIVIFWKY